MKREKKSSPGWRRTKLADIDPQPFSSEALQRLVELMPLKNNVAVGLLHQELQDYAILYLSAKANFDHAPRPASQRDALKKLRDKLASAGEALQALDDESRDRLYPADTAVDDDATSSPLTLDQIQAFVAHIDKSRDAIQDFGPRKGARPLFVHALAGLWFQFTGKRPTRTYGAHPASDDKVYTEAAKGEAGAFRNFVFAVVEALDPEDIEHGLDDNIRKAVKAIRPMG